MTSSRLEVLVEPFKEDAPGPHVMAVLEILNEHNLVVDMGPFSTTATGELDELIAIVQPLLAAGFEAGATNIQTRIERL